MFEWMCTRRGDKNLRRGPRKCKRGYQGRMRLARVLTTEEVVFAWKTIWNTVSSCSNPRALGGVPESVREDIEGEMVDQVLTTRVAYAKVKANSTRLNEVK
jgi:hypothetical protein